MPSSNIPTSTSVLESVVIKAPLSQVWHFIKLQDFSKFWTALSKSEFVKGANDEADLVRWTFKDGSIYEVKQEEHSVRTHRGVATPPHLKLVRLGCERPANMLHERTHARTQTIHYTITYSIITASPGLTYSSVLSTIRLHAVTAGAHAGSTYVEWSASFSSDATAGKSPTSNPRVLGAVILIQVAEVISDAKYKRIEALSDLEKAATKA
ncbi:hypothetical protein DHEL01_v208669 [Diaporthe helianthi]|uniref:Bet v1-like protein n=1 Tax=Diaporthe helianthi TaxID=158607 RepID=A0A2P5HRQ4_DIAHE|nr:hypothetical protein DHEL01_v208669 [Diaporthe helianthi]